MVDTGWSHTKDILPALWLIPSFSYASKNVSETCPALPELLLYVNTAWVETCWDARQ